jgi:NRPS condensation-like uncharacterized protein
MKYHAQPFDIWHYMCTKYGDYEPVLRGRLDFAGHLDEQILKQAVTLSLDSVRELTCRYEDAEPKTRWVTTSYTVDDLVRVIEVDGDPTSEILRVFADTIDPLVGPQTKITLVRTPTSDTYCQLMNHQICDMGGYKQYLSLVADLYTGLRQNQPPPKLRPGNRGTNLLVKTITWPDRIRLYRHPGIMLRSTQRSAETGLDFPGGPVSPYLLRRVLAADQFGAVKRFCHAHDATVNDLMMTLFARAWAQATGQDQVQLPSTMDLRKYLPQPSQLGVTNLSQVCLCTVSIQPDDPLETTLAQMSEQMRAYKHTDTVKRSTMMWSLLCQLLPNHRLYEMFPDFLTINYLAYTNCGVFDPRTLNFDGLPLTDAFGTGALKPRPFLGLDVSTFNDQCSLLIGIHGTDWDRQFADALLDEIFDAATAL